MTRIAYTIGYAEGYDAELAKDDPVVKRGADADYHGGIAWQTPTGAQIFLASRQFTEAFPGRTPDEFAVYRMELPTDWETDVTPEGHLLHNAVVVERWESELKFGEPE